MSVCVTCIARDYRCMLFACSLGDIEEAVKCLELYVNVAERVQSKEPLAKACSAAGIMFNTLVSGYIFFLTYLTLVHVQ